MSAGHFKFVSNCHFYVVWKFLNVFCVFVNFVAIVLTVHHSKDRTHTKFIILQKRVVSLWTVIGDIFFGKFFHNNKKTYKRSTKLPEGDNNRKKYHNGRKCI